MVLLAACRILCKPILSQDDLLKADHLLLKFCCTVQTLYGSFAITPNMHMHGHLVKCMREYGPVTSFWLFSFERYNGILGAFSNNKKDIEVQLMRKFLSISFAEVPRSHLHSVDADDVIPVIESAFPSIRETPDDSISIAAPSFFTPSQSISSVIWDDSDVSLPSKYTLHSLDLEELEWLASVYEMLFPNLVIATETLPVVCKKYLFVNVGAERFGHRSRSRKQKCSILASWAGEDGAVNTTSHYLRAGEIGYFIHHSCTVRAKSDGSQMLLSLTFAVVNWFKHIATDPTYRLSFLPPIVELQPPCFIPRGPATFMPVKRIASVLALAPSPFRCGFKIGVPLLSKNVVH